MQAGGGQNQGAEDAVEIVDHATADEGERRAGGGSRRHDQAAQPVIGRDILRPRPDLQQGAVNVEKIGASSRRRERRQTAGSQGPGTRRQVRHRDVYQTPSLAMDAQGSRFGSGPPFCNNSIEMASGERMKAIWPSRGGLLIVTPAFINLSQVA